MVQKHTLVVGSFEPISFPDFNDYAVQAKIDTGAYSGALHCTEIHVDKSGDVPVLHFSPFDHPEIEMASTRFTTRRVRSSNGTAQKRYFIKTRITLNDKTYPITISLADRSEMRWPVLIGRKFLKDNQFLVDVNKTHK